MNRSSAAKMAALRPNQDSTRVRPKGRFPFCPPADEQPECMKMPDSAPWIRGGQGWLDAGRPPPAPSATEEG